MNHFVGAVRMEEKMICFPLVFAVLLIQRMASDQPNLKRYLFLKDYTTKRKNNYKSFLSATMEWIIKRYISRYLVRVQNLGSEISKICQVYHTRSNNMR